MKKSAKIITCCLLTFVGLAGGVVAPTLAYYIPRNFNTSVAKSFDSKLPVNSTKTNGPNYPKVSSNGEAMQITCKTPNTSSKSNDSTSNPSNSESFATPSGSSTGSETAFNSPANPASPF